MKKLSSQTITNIVLSVLIVLMVAVIIIIIALDVSPSSSSSSSSSCGGKSKVDNICGSGTEAVLWRGDSVDILRAQVKCVRRNMPRHWKVVVLSQSAADLPNDIVVDRMFVTATARNDVDGLLEYIQTKQEVNDNGEFIWLSNNVVPQREVNRCNLIRRDAGRDVYRFVNGVVDDSVNAGEPVTAPTMISTFLNTPSSTVDNWMLSLSVRNDVVYAPGICQQILLVDDDRTNNISLGVTPTKCELLLTMSVSDRVSRPSTRFDTLNVAIANRFESFT
jgi:hypothetical protein